MNTQFKDLFEINKNNISFCTERNTDVESEFLTALSCSRYVMNNPKYWTHLNLDVTMCNMKSVDQSYFTYKKFYSKTCCKNVNLLQNLHEKSAKGRLDSSSEKNERLYIILGQNKVNGFILNNFTHSITNLKWVAAVWNELTDCNVHVVFFSQSSESVQTATLVVVLEEMDNTCMGKEMKYQKKEEGNCWQT